MTAALIIIAIMLGAAAVFYWLAAKRLHDRVEALSSQLEQQNEAVLELAGELEASIRRREVPAPGVRARQIILDAVRRVPD